MDNERGKLRQVNRIETILTRSLEIILAILLLAIVCIVVLLVVMRYVFNSSITGANELITILFVYSTAIGAAVCMGKNEHISIPFAIDALPAQLQKMVDKTGVLLVAVLNGVMFLYSVQWIRVTGDYLMPSTGFPRMVVQLSIPIGCGLAIVYCLIRLLLDAPNSADSERVDSRESIE